ncbi:MAG: right-handed parallel beta-helix repeat-containing protein [Kofleriaceae bacterium]
MWRCTVTIILGLAACGRLEFDPVSSSGVDACETGAAFFDNDRDGWGGDAAPCGTTSGVVSTPGDCNDDSDAVHPDASDDCLGDRSCDGAWIVAVPAECPTIQAVLDAAAATGNEATVTLGAGTHVENIRFDGARVTVVGEGPGVTTLRGTGTGPVVVFANEGTIAQGVRGMTITGGVCDIVVDDCRGGGIVVDRSAPELTDLAIAGNVADAPDAAYGGGIALIRSGARLADVDIHANTATYYGGGVYHESDSSTLERVRIFGNMGPTYGGGVASYYSSPRYDNVIVAGNDGALGGGLMMQAGSPRLSQLTVVGNTCTSGCGIYAITDTAIDLDDSTFSENVPSGAGGAIELEAGSTVTIGYSNFFGNGASPFSGMPSPIGANGNLGVDPKFIDDVGADPGAWNLKLGPTSQLRNAGDPSVLDLDGSRSDIGAFGGPLAWP